MPKLTLALAAALILLITNTAMSRDSITLTDGWKFKRAEADLAAPFAEWEMVTVPHTWNALDGQNGRKADPEYPDGYYRGPAWYVKPLEIPAAWKGRRIFIRFEAASLVSDAYLNGAHLGQHRGAFAAFCYELTSKVKFGAENILRVRVDNSHTEEVMPLSGDFTVFGGIYRPVHLFATEQDCITPLDYATSGVYVTTKELTADKATLEIETKINNTAKHSGTLTLSSELLDKSGAVAKSSTTEIQPSPDKTRSERQTILLDHPHLWNGRKDPYLYTLHSKLLRDGKVIDEVTQTVGLRTVQLTNEQGFLLNGQPYPVHGVNRHQERQDKGWALSHADNEEDFQIIAEIGATAVRLAHYQQSEDVHDICDRKGFVCWEEIPNVERVSSSPAFDENALEQLREMILQGYNRPSIVWRGIFNELNANWIKTPDGGPVVDPAPVLHKLYALAKKLDPSRPIVAASWTTDHLPFLQIVDWQSYNTYPGWYWGKLQDFAEVIDKGSATIGGKRVAISEYGAGANIQQHVEGPVTKPDAPGQFHPEEYQAVAHETFWNIAQDNPKLWGTFVWAMFDFASDHRDEGKQPGINDKGLVTHDRRLRKDAFYFYQANWTDKPMVHIAARRLIERKRPTTEVKVYSNCEKVELRVNGKAMPAVTPDSTHIYKWEDITLQPGPNTIEATASNAGQNMSDKCNWNLAK
ncbi:MAG: glycoside hydrolase family 2 protein [Chthoniobacterales bacterium]|nr:glycoside hydrolase family 2 protein [Chthoniobacterales bacterium]